MGKESISGKGAWKRPSSAKRGGNPANRRRWKLKSKPVFAPSLKHESALQYPKSVLEELTTPKAPVAYGRKSSTPPQPAADVGETKTTTVFSKRGGRKRELQQVQFTFPRSSGGEPFSFRSGCSSRPSGSSDVAAKAQKRVTMDDILNGTTTAIPPVTNGDPIVGVRSPYLSGVSVEEAVRDKAGLRPRSNSTDGELELPSRYVRPRGFTWCVGAHRSSLTLCLE